MVTIETLLDLLAKHGGEIVCTASLEVWEINQARASERMYVNEDSLGFVWIPNIDCFPETVEGVEFFEKWYPLHVEMPEELQNPNWLFKALEERKKEQLQLDEDSINHIKEVMETNKKNMDEGNIEKKYFVAVRFADDRPKNEFQIYSVVDRHGNPAHNYLFYHKSDDCWYFNGRSASTCTDLIWLKPVSTREIFTYDDMMDIAGWMAAADNKRPIAELKEEAEVYIKTKLASREPNKTREDK